MESIQTKGPSLLLLERKKPSDPRHHLWEETRVLQDSRQSFPGPLTIIFSISPPALEAGNHSRHLRKPPRGGSAPCGLHSQGPGPEHNPGLALEGFCKQGEGRKEEREEDGLTTWAAGRVAILSRTFSLPPRMSKLWEIPESPVITNIINNINSNNQPL